MASTESKCIVCGEVTTSVQRGLCIRCYERFRRAKQKVAAAERLEFEQLLVDNGQLLPSRQGKSVVDDVFADAAAAFMASRSSEAEQLIAEVEKGVEAHKKKVAKKKAKDAVAPKK